MAPVIAMLQFCRLPTLDAVQFRTYIEEKHVPLVRSLLGPKSPSSHTRYYLNEDSKFVVGSHASTDPDGIAIIVYEDEEVMRQSMQARNADGIREQIEADEAKFMDRSSIRLVVFGERDVRVTLGQGQST